MAADLRDRGVQSLFTDLLVAPFTSEAKKLASSDAAHAGWVDARVRRLDQLTRQRHDVIAAGKLWLDTSERRGLCGQTAVPKGVPTLMRRSVLPILSLMGPDREKGSTSGHKAAVLGRFAYFGTLPVCIAGLAVWAGILVTEGPVEGLKYSWLLAIAAYLGLPPLLAKLRVDGSVLRMTVIGPWRQSVDLDALESVQWKRTGGPASRGSMFIRDHRGGKVRIGVGDFSGVDAWGPLILSSAEKRSVSVDDASCRALQGAGRRDRA